MNIQFFRFWVCLAFSFIFSTAFSQLDSIEIKAKQLLSIYPAKTQFSIALVDGNNVSFIGLIKEKEGISTINNQNDVFEIASVTKTFTNTVLAQLVEDKKLSLQDNFTSFLPFTIPLNDTISLLHLANHTSGLPRLPTNLDLAKVNPTNPYQSYDVKMLEKYLQSDIKTNRKVGEIYEYSNLGTGLLGYVLEKSQKSSIEKLIQQLVLKKYGLNATFVNRADVKKLNLVKGINQFGFETSYWDLNGLFAAGGILSTASDLAKYLQAHFDINNKALLLTRKATFTISPEMEIGLGWHIIHGKAGQEYIWHNGGSGGFTSSVAMDIKHKKGVVILSNISNYHKDSYQLDALTFKILGYLNNK